MSAVPACYTRRLRRARKAHECCECRGVIEEGERYHCHSGVWDGVAGQAKVCVDCESLREVLDRDLVFDDEATAFGHVYERVGEVMHDDPEVVMRYAEIVSRRRGSLPRFLAEAVAEMQGSGRAAA